MPSLTRRQSLALLATAAFATTRLEAAPAPATAPAPARKWKTTPPREAIRARYFPNHLLVTHEGRHVRLYDDLIKDKIVLLNFMYASCDRICPRVTDNLVSVQ